MGNLVKNIALNHLQTLKCHILKTLKKYAASIFNFFCRKKSSDKEAENIGEKSVELIKIFEGLRAQYMQNKS